MKKIREIDGIMLDNGPPIIGTILFCHKCRRTFKSNKNTRKVEGKYVCPRCIEDGVVVCNSE